MKENVLEEKEDVGELEPGVDVGVMDGIPASEDDDEQAPPYMLALLADIKEELNNDIFAGFFKS